MVLFYVRKKLLFYSSLYWVTDVYINNIMFCKNIIIENTRTFEREQKLALCTSLNNDARIMIFAALDLQFFKQF